MRRKFPYVKGARIKVTGHINDPHPPAIGDKGVVDYISGKGTPLEQVTIRWDNGRTIMLVPEDYGSISYA